MPPFIKVFILSVIYFFMSKIHKNHTINSSAPTTRLKRALNSKLKLISKNRKITARDLYLNPNKSYFILHASFGDKWCIISFLHEFLKHQNDARVLASKKDIDLLRIFLGDKSILSSIEFVHDEILRIISDHITPSSASSTQISIDNKLLTQTNALVRSGFPRNTIRHLHLVKYPYFSDFHFTHGVPYGTCMRMILGLPSDSFPIEPKFYSAQDKLITDKIIHSNRNPNAIGSIIFNVINISHEMFREDHISKIIQLFEERNVQVFLNIANHPEDFDAHSYISKTTMAVPISIPGHLLALACTQVNAVIGVIGGAMNVAVQFATSHVLSFYKNGNYIDVPLRRLYGGNYTDNIWQAFSPDWPCFFEGRIVRFVDASESENWTDEHLASSIENFIIDINLVCG
jgi:hypothetical protein